uniref:F-BAR domain-containing protein n=1 Tax=Macrostomum lignano TaxID=282301 RepID=A0A1I8H7D1_9PLAT
GFDVLYANFANGAPAAAAEFLSLLRELGHCEEAYQKGLAKLAKRVGALKPGAATGSFAPCWEVLAAAVDGLAGAHALMSAAHLALMKEAQKYADEQAKAVKAFKDSEHQKTQASSASIKTFSAQVQAKRQVCQAKQAEAAAAASEKEKRKAVAKLESAAKELGFNVEKYNSVRSAFVEGMKKSCAYFEEMETQHLAKMLDFVDRFLEPIASAGTRLVEAKGQL